MAADRVAQAFGAVRFVSGASFLLDPLRANRFWGVSEDPGPSARLLLRSMGYRDALIGAILFAVGLRGGDSRAWFLISAGADVADLIGTFSVRTELPRKELMTGLAGAGAGAAVAVLCAARGRQPLEMPSKQRRLSFAR